MSIRRVTTNTTLIYFLGLFMVGMAYIAILPPFEGFDENAHFSRVKEISASFRSALNAQSFIDQTVLDFNGPMPYSSGEPPYNLGNTYPSFFANPNAVNLFVEHYRNEPFILGFTPSNEQNWQIQHPPLYYLLMAPLFSHLGSLSFITQLTILRLVSFFISICGFFFGYLAYRNTQKNRTDRSGSLIGFAFYPIIFPMFFLEFARVGNDSLCILLVGMISYCLSLWLSNKDQSGKLFFVGLLLGAGLLTKAFFIPIALGMLFFLLSQHIFQAMTQARVRDLCRDLGFLLVPIIIVGGSWYLFKLFAHGDLGLGGEASSLGGTSALWSGLMNNFHLLGFLRGLLVPLVSFSWAGTWSLVRFPIIMQLPLILLGAWVFWEFVKAFRISSLPNYESLALLMFILLYLGLAVHVLISMAISGLGTSGGWYLHILSPWLAPAVGVALHSFLRVKFKRIMLLALITYSLLFQWIAIWAHMALFSGCAIKANDKEFMFSAANFCLDQAPVIFNRLQILANPYISLVMFLLGFSLLIMTMLRVLKIETTR